MYSHPFKVSYSIPKQNTRIPPTKRLKRRKAINCEQNESKTAGTIRIPKNSLNRKSMNKILMKL